ncbi:MAG: hypothetical protein JF607_14535 [Burkholderiales bacterium]|nr:hypothetical protein [Burkholderiales bacterium]
MKGLASYLQYNPDDAESRELFVPGANWEDASAYPPIKAAGDLKRADYLRLAWELLRRMPRYRRQLSKLKQLDFRKATFFLGAPGSFFSDKKLPTFNGWGEVPLRGHQCTPRPTSREATLGKYVAARQKDERPWLLVHRRRWCLDYWGVNRMEVHQRASADVDLETLFTPPAQRVDPPWTGKPAPRLASTLLNPVDVLMRLRLDTPFDSQMQLFRREFEEAQKTFAAAEEGNFFDSWGVLGRSGEATDKFVSGKATAAAGARVLLKQIELSSLWLRTWDYEQALRQETDSLRPRLDRLKMKRQFKRDAEIQRIGGVLSVELYDQVKNTEPAMAANWRNRGIKYIEQTEEAYRQLVALALSPFTPA